MRIVAVRSTDSTGPSGFDSRALFGISSAPVLESDELGQPGVNVAKTATIRRTDMLHSIGGTAWDAPAFVAARCREPIAAKTAVAAEQLPATLSLMLTRATQVLSALADPASYDPRPTDVSVVHTHASVVFLVGERVYKIKKPVDLGFLDYSTLARREAMCRSEVELNCRLARDVYIDVAPITQHGDQIAIGGSGPVVEWAVVMRRLDEAGSWSTLVAERRLGATQVHDAARHIARFHREAPRGRAEWGSFEAVAGACRDNIVSLRRELGDSALLRRVELATERELEARRELITTRARNGVVREIHGDLRLEHLYDVGARGRAEDLRIIDCIEFSDALRHGDPAADIAFLAMDLRMHGAWSLADELTTAWAIALEDPGAAELLPLYSAYRSAVRAKVRTLQAHDRALDDAARHNARSLAVGHLVLALGELAQPDERPALVLVGGLPGTGKSRLAADLQQRGDMTWIRADAVRKELAGLRADASGKSTIEGGIYTHEWNDRTYGECLGRARAILEDGGRVIVDASFKEERRREELIAVARACGARVHLLICTAPPDAVRTRLAERRDDPSDADWMIYEHAVRTWEPLGASSEVVTSTIDTERPHEQTVASALECLRSCGILGAP